MKNTKLIIGIIVIIVLVIIVIVLISNSKKVTVNKTGTTVTQQGFLDTIIGILTPKGTTTGTSTTASTDHFYCKIFPKLCPNPDCFNKTKDHPGCLSSKPGYNCNNELDSYC